MLRQLLKEKYGEVEPVRLTGGYRNDTFLLKGTSPLLVAKVLKSGNDDNLNELNALQALSKTGIAPEVYDVIEMADACVLVMAYRDGRNGQAILDSGEFKVTGQLYKRMGQALARNIHSIRYSSPEGIRECGLKKLSMTLPFVPKTFREQSEKLLRKLEDPKREWVLTHGDYGIHNALFTDGETLTVLDYEWAEWSNPLTDISWVHWFTNLHYSDHAKPLTALFMEGYRSVTPVVVDPEEMKAYGVYKVWSVLYRIQQSPREVQEEWVRRLHWTLETDWMNGIPTQR